MYDLSKKQQIDFDTIMEVANVEFSLTHNTCIMKVPIKVPKILKTILLRLRDEDTTLLAHIMGESFLQVIKEQLQSTRERR